MSPSKGTAHRPIRIPGELWAAVQDKAAAEGTNASAVIRQLLNEWVNSGPAESGISEANGADGGRDTAKEKPEGE